MPEHTWGVAQFVFLRDFTNWTNAQFDIARNALTEPLLNIYEPEVRADYYSTQQSWEEQRTYITHAADAVEKDFPDFADRLRKTLHELIELTPPSTQGFKQVSPDDTYSCGNFPTLQFNRNGSIDQLIDTDGNSWARDGNELGKFLYQTFTFDDFVDFMDDFGLAKFPDCELGNGSDFKDGKP